MLWSSVLNAGFFLLLYPMEMLSKNGCSCVVALLAAQLGFRGRVPWTMCTDAVKWGDGQIFQHLSCLFANFFL